MPTIKLRSIYDVSVLPGLVSEVTQLVVPLLIGEDTPAPGRPRCDPVPPVGLYVQVPEQTDTTPTFDGVGRGVISRPGGVLSNIVWGSQIGLSSVLVSGKVFLPVLVCEFLAGPDGPILGSPPALNDTCHVSRLLLITHVAVHGVSGVPVVKVPLTYLLPPLSVSG